MKKFLTLILSTLLLSSAFAQSEEETSPLSVTMYGSWMSQYVAQNGALCYDDPVVYSGVTVAHDSGFYVDLWHCGAADEKFFDNENGWGSEFDLTLGWAGPLGDSGLDGDFGVAYWLLGDINDFRDVDTLFGFAKVSKTFTLTDSQSLAPFLRLNSYTVLDGYDGDGINFTVGTLYKLKILERLHFSLEGALVWDDGTYGVESGSTISRLITNLDYEISKNFLIQLFTVRGYFPLESLEDSRETKVIFGSGASFTF